jgi:exodeoxyribonuclease V beta subunit
MDPIFHLLDTDLSGDALIEASAGTGKTFTIAAIYLRLIIEAGLTVDGILVVTFTEAATAELKERIRNRLREAALSFEGGRSDDPFIRGLMERHPDPGTALDRLRSAIRDFDEAAIFTIHGFCMRMLRESAFESGGLFDTELMTDTESIMEEVAADFWRCRFYDASPLFVNYALGRKYTPDAFRGLMKAAVSAQSPRIIPRITAPDTARLESDYREAFRSVADAWPAARQGVSDLLTATTALNLNQYKKEKIPLWIEEMDALPLLDPDTPVLPGSFAKFTPAALRKALKKNQSLPVHPFFDLCGTLDDARAALTEAFEARLLALKIDLFDTAAEALQAKKARHNRMAFDDLLLNLYQALTADTGPALAAAIRTRFRAALIDEFQDTDPIQYAIFNILFSGPESRLFLIGDPKQAIYGFRGADVFAYMAARERAQHRYTLGENWRSEPDLVTAVNTVFGNVARPFLYDAIPFAPVSPAENPPNPTRLTLDGRAEPPLQIWRMAPEEGAKPITKGTARPRIYRAVASEIARLIAAGRSGRARINQTGLQPGDIAVLLRANREAREMQQALLARRIPAVLQSTESLFKAPEAAEMERVLQAMARPGEPGPVRTALATELLGRSAGDIDRFTLDEAAWEEQLTAFRDLHRLWATRGFMRAFKALLSGNGVLPRLMALPDGERRCTNLLHLAEVLHTVEASERTGMAGLVKWLSQQREHGSPRTEAHQLRLESDARAVKLVTIHKSKGLEYPVVFCPFFWSSSTSGGKEPVVAFHEETGDRRLILDLGSDRIDDHRALADKESLAENLRLLYVALTRARNRCVLIWGKFNQAETAAPAWLFHPPPPGETDDPLTALGAHFKGLDPEAVAGDLDRLGEVSGGTLSVAPMPEEPAEAVSSVVQAPPDLAPRTFSGVIDDRFRVTSFSALTRDGGEAPPHPDGPADRDAALPAPAPPDPATDRRRTIFSFPRGARPGTLLHLLLETIDFTDHRPGTLDPVIAGALSGHGIDPEWKGVVAGMIRKVLSTPLLADRPDFTLSRLGADSRLNELGFYFPLNPLTPARLAEAFGGTPAPPDSDRFRFKPTEGFLMGFIDLVFRFEGRFYLVDWKSNHLGDEIGDYHRSRLGDAMTAHQYDLQYYLYTVALDQYLQRRMAGYRYQTHFGGVFYLFLRGMDPEMGPDYGIFHDRPPAERVAALSDLLIDRSGVAEAAS